MKLEKGTFVNVWEDPLSGIKLEGEAKLIEEYRPDEGDGLSLWVVQFEGVGEPEVLRTISLENCEINETL